jgi:DNA-binding transcriptional MerR regulator
MSQDLNAPQSTLPACAADGQEPSSHSSERTELTIGETAQAFGITRRTLRFYEGKGLLTPRREGSARFYDLTERERLASILKAKALGFTLCEIRQMLPSSPQPEEAGVLSISRRQCFEQIKLLERRKREIEEALAELRRTYTSFYVRMVNEMADGGLRAPPVRS